MFLLLKKNVLEMYNNLPIKIMNICYANFDMHMRLHIYIYHFIIYDSTL